MEWRRWSVNWQGRLQGEGGELPLFITRRECREFIQKKYGYIKDRPDLRAPPFHWKMPKPIRVIIAMDPTP